MTILQVLQRLFVMLDGSLELLDVLCATFTKGGLRLSITLFALLRSGINLMARD